MKKIFLLFIFIQLILTSQTKFSKVAIPIKNKSDVIKLASLGLAVDHYSVNSKREMEVFLSEEECQILKDNHILFYLLIENWDEYYKSEQKKLVFNDNEKLNSTPKNFRYGTMGGYYTLAEAYAELDSMRKMFPNLISQNDTIGKTLNGRPIIAIKISDNPNIKENEPQVLYTALHHAREPESLTQLYYFIWHILENYNSSDESKFLIDNRELHFIPIVNPDGYFYNQRTNPNGGGMWRKNRFARGVNDTVGVDLNRNYGFKWGLNDEGSSGNPTAQTYRGPSAFSELETKAVKNYCDKNNFRMAFNYHTYTNLLIYPWGFSYFDSNDSVYYRELSEDLTSVNRYAYGTGIQTVAYYTNGDSDDWMYGDTTAHKKIFSWTPEVGGGMDGFWPQKNRIIPLAEENLTSNYKLAQAAGIYFKLNNLNFVRNSIIKPIDTMYFKMEFKNLGIEKSNKLLKISINKIITQNLQSYKIIDSIAYLTPILSKDVYEFRVAHFRTNHICNPLAPNLIPIKIETDASLTLDTLNFIDGVKQIVFKDNFDSSLTKNWTITGTWGLTNTSKSGPFAATESPNGNYTNNLKATLTLKNYVKLDLSCKYVLKFWTKWHIETNYDFMKVQVSNDSGKTWNNVKGLFTSEGFGYAPQTPLYTHGYDAIKHDWVHEQIELNNFFTSQTNNNFLVRFNFESDSYENTDGFYLDDLEIEEWRWQIIADVKDNLKPRTYSLSQNYPNPFNPSTNISFSIPNDEFVELKIYDILGNEVSTLIEKKMEAGDYTFTYQQNNLSTGIYFYRIKVGTFIKTNKMIFLK